MAFTGWYHAPFSLRYLIGKGNGRLAMTVVVDTGERWMDRDLLKHDYYSLSWKNYS